MTRSRDDRCDVRDNTGSTGTGSAGGNTPMGSLGSGANKDGGSGR